MIHRLLLLIVHNNELNQVKLVERSNDVTSDFVYREVRTESASEVLPEEQNLPDTSDDEDFDKTPDELDDIFEQVASLALNSQAEGVSRINCKWI